MHLIVRNNNDDRYNVIFEEVNLSGSFFKETTNENTSENQLLNDVFNL